MQITFDIHERRIIREQLREMALNAANLSERDIYKALVRLAEKFSDNREVSRIKHHEAYLLLGAISKTYSTLLSISDKIKNSDKKKKEKEENLEKTKMLINTTKNIINKLKDKLNVCSKE